MAPPTRASSVSTKIIGFRLTADETQRLDQLVEELGHKDRSSLLRAWLAQSGPVPRIADDASSQPARAKTKKASAHAQQPACEIETAHLNRDSDSPNQTPPSEKPHFAKIAVMLRNVILHEKDPRSGLSPIPNVIRALLPQFTPAQIYAVMGLLGGIGALELHPKGRERLSSEDEAMCPIDAAGTLWTRMRWIEKE